MSETIVDEKGQATLLDLGGRELNAYWVDEKQNLFIPNNPLHFKAHKLQVLLARLDKQLVNNPAQFNASVYKSILEEYTKCVEDINNGGISIRDGRPMDDDGQSGPTDEVGPGDAASVDSRISPDNPFAR